MSVIGIDFGNASCVIAQVKRGGIDIVLNENTQRLTRCVVTKVTAGTLRENSHPPPYGECSASPDWSVLDAPGTARAGAAPTLASLARARSRRNRAVPRPHPSRVSVTAPRPRPRVRRT
jgi:hypothetical protein